MKSVDESCKEVYKDYAEYHRLAEELGIRPLPMGANWYSHWDEIREREVRSNLE